MDSASQLKTQIEELYRLNHGLYCHLAQMLSTEKEELESWCDDYQVDKRNLMSLLCQLEEVSYLSSHGMFEVLNGIEVPLTGLPERSGDGAPSV